MQNDKIYPIIENQDIEDKPNEKPTAPLLQYRTMIQEQLKKQKSFVKYDPFRSPPDFILAKKHGIAQRVCKDQSSKIEDYSEMSDSLEDMKKRLEINPHSNSDDFSLCDSKVRIDLNSFQQSSKVDEKCPCCSKNVQNEQLKLCVDLKYITHLGVTYPLYFQFIKKCFLLLLIQFLNSGWYNLFTNLMGTACENILRTDFMCKQSIMNVKYSENDDNLSIQAYSNSITVIILIILIEMFKVNQEVNRFQLETHRITPADYTVEMKGLSSEITIDDVQKFIKYSLRTDQAPRICKIYFIFDMEYYTKLYRTKVDLHKQKNIMFAEQRKGHFKQNKQQLQFEEFDTAIAKLDYRIQQIEEYLTQYQYKLTNSYLSVVMQEQQGNYIKEEIGDEDIPNFSGRVLVTFDNAHDAKQVVRKWKMNQWEYFWFRIYKYGFFKSYCKKQLNRLIYQNKIQRVSRAAEPSDIIWANIGTNKQKTRQRILINLTIFAILSLSFGFLVGMKKGIKKSQLIQENQLWQIILSFAASTVVALTNTLIGITIRKFAGLETHKKQTNYFVSVGRSLSNLFFVNMVLTTLGANFTFISDNSKGFPFALDGLIGDFFFLFITNTYLSSLFNYFDIVWGFKLLKRTRELKKGGLSSLSQREANQLFEGHPADMALRYANIVKLMFFTAIVSGFLPFGILMSMLGLIILYWVDKYLVLRRYVCNNYLDAQLANTMISMLPQFTMFLGLGNLLTTLIPVLQDQTISKFVWPEFQRSAYFYISLFTFIFSLFYRLVFRYSFVKRLYYKIFSIEIKKKRVDVTFTEQKHLFKQDYDVYHPVIREYILQKENEAQTEIFNSNPNEKTKVKPELLRSIQQRV